MKKDLDAQLYNEYLNGEKEAFELLYHKYNEKIKYFVFNIVKDYQKAEDITQETFMYVLQNKMREGYDFKYYIYLVAKSRALNYVNVEKIRKEINEKYLENNSQVEQDVLDIVTKSETKKEMIEAISLLDNKYKNAVYLAKIEEFSYSQTAEILGETIQNTKTLIHRGKNELRKILLKKEVTEMNNGLKVLMTMFLVGIILTGIVYATQKIINKAKVSFTPVFTSKISTIDTNKVWIGTFNLIWNDFMDEVVGGEIEFEDGYSELASQLNEKTFTTKQLSPNSYFKIYGESTLELKNKIANTLKDKFNEESNVLDRVAWGQNNSYILYAMLKKDFTYLEEFPELEAETFKGSEEKVKYFGIQPDTAQLGNKNVEILFYHSKEDFAIKLKTNEGEEIILYKTTGQDKSFEENYMELQEKSQNYDGDTEFNKNDTLKIPYIHLKDEINYDELCGRMIKGTYIYIRQAIQTIDFDLNNVGGNVKSESLIEYTYGGTLEEGKELIFDSDFILYLKENDKEKPYFALKVDNTDVLVTSE